MKNSPKTHVTIVSKMTDGLAYQVEVVTSTVNNMLADAFAITNRDDRPLGRYVCSTSVGDLMLVNGRCFVVANVGWNEITPEQAARWQKVEGSDWNPEV